MIPCDSEYEEDEAGMLNWRDGLKDRALVALGAVGGSDIRDPVDSNAGVETDWRNGGGIDADVDDVGDGCCELGGEVFVQIGDETKVWVEAKNRCQ